MGNWYGKVVHGRPTRVGSHNGTGTPAPALSPKETIMLAFLVAAQTLVADRFDKKNDRGATAVEYGLLVGLIAVVIIGAVFLLGGTLNDMFTDVNTTLNNPAGTTTTATTT